MADQPCFSVANFVEEAKTLGALDTCTVWALVAFVSLGFIWWNKKREIKNNEQWQDIRSKQIANETAQTEVMRSLVDKVAGLEMIVVKHLIKSAND